MEGTISPLFLYLKMDKQRIRQLVDEAIAENEDMFLIDLSFLEGDKILVEVDAYSGVNLTECIRISRYVEQSLDSEEVDYALEVTTPDIAKPLKVFKQYKKNIGRIMEVVLVDGQKFEGVLKGIDENKITLEWKAREPKPIGKGKVTVVKTAEPEYKEIKEAKVKIIFN